jgi:predicted transcriptional regulator
MNRNYTIIPAETTLQQLVDHHILVSGRCCFIVTQGDKVMSLLTLHRIKEAPRTEWPTTTAAQVMIPAPQMKRVQPDAELWTALEAMDRDGVNHLPVMPDGRMLGLLSRDDIVGFLRAPRIISFPLCVIPMCLSAK